MTTPERVLFVCEHGSAKSVIAAAHFARLALEKGVDAHAASRGTSPDSSYPPHVVAGLARDGIAPLEEAPRQLTAADFDGVTHVIAFCDVTPPAGSSAEAFSWSDVPAVSEGYDAARDEIIRRLEKLLQSL